MLLSPSAHRILDFVTVVAFAAAPALLGFGGLPAILAYVLAAVHLLMTLATRFPDAPSRPLPIGLHSFVELVVGVMLLILPWLLGWEPHAQVFFLAAGVVILAVWLGTRYTDRKPRRAR